jgi:phosphatidylethanolamine-binding protein (PEBP) family uncharacterized protein
MNPKCAVSLFMLAFSMPLMIRGQEPGKLPPPIAGPTNLIVGNTSVFTLTSPELRSYTSMPVKFTLGGQQRVSPPLTWTGAPSNTAEFVVELTDPESGTCAEPELPNRVHWLVTNIPASVTSFTEGVVPQRAHEIIPYHPVCLPPAQPEWRSKHNWHFVVFALSEPLKLPSNANHDEVFATMKGKILASARLRPFTKRDIKG